MLWARSVASLVSFACRFGESRRSKSRLCAGGLWAIIGCVSLLDESGRTNTSTPWVPLSLGATLALDITELHKAAVLAPSLPAAPCAAHEPFRGGLTPNVGGQNCKVHFKSQNTDAAMRMGRRCLCDRSRPNRDCTRTPFTLHPSVGSERTLAVLTRSKLLQV